MRGFSVFAGGLTLEAAEAVAAGDPIAKDDVVYLLIALVEKSLVVADEDGDRYRMLETVREYAKEKLAATGSPTRCGPNIAITSWHWQRKQSRS